MPGYASKLLSSLSFFKVGYERFLERPLRVCGELAAVGGVCAGGWAIIDHQVKAPSRNYISSNGYSLDTEGYAYAIQARDSDGVKHFRKLGIDPLPSGQLCSTYSSAKDLDFLIENDLIDKKGDCGIRYGRQSIDHRAMNDICVNNHCRLDDDEKLAKLTDLVKACQGANCTRLAEMRKKYRQSYSDLQSTEVRRALRDKEGYVAICLNGTRGMPKRSAAERRLITLRVAGRRRLYNYDQRLVGGDNRACVGDPVWPGTDMLGTSAGDDYPSDERPYGVMYCVAIDEVERRNICEGYWDDMLKTLNHTTKISSILAE